VFSGLFGYISITSMICPPSCRLFVFGGILLSICYCSSLVYLEASIVFGMTLDFSFYRLQCSPSFFVGSV
jgi:hypothetical protein